MAVISPVSEDLVNQSWEKIKNALKTEYGDATFKSWLKFLDFAGLRNGQVMMTVPTRFIREWIVAHYLDALRRLWCREFPSIKSVDIFVKPLASNQQKNVVNLPSAEDLEISGANLASASFVKPLSQNDDARMQEEDDGYILDSRYTFDTFVVGRPNELAFAAAKRVANSSETTKGANPLYVYGGVGLGKTHLMHAIAWQARKVSRHRKVMYVSAEKFMYQFIKAIKQKDLMGFKDQFRSVDVLLLDDVQFICGKESTQEEFFHTFNALIDQNKQVVISADRSPNDLEGLDERVKSRLGWGLVVDLQTTNFELRLGILQAKMQSMMVNVPLKVLEFLAQKITTNVRELEGALNRVVAHSTLVDRPISLENTEELLHDLLKSHDRKISIEEIQKKVADHFKIKVADMHSARRSRAIARPRQVAMFLAKKLTTKSLPEIGRKFGGKDHTTVIHAVKKIEELCIGDRSFAEEVEHLSRILQN